MVFIETENLTFGYPSSKHEYTFPDIHLPKGENLLLSGNSGSGKTTLLHLIAGILTPSSGSIAIDNVRTEELKPHGMDRFRGENIGIIFQENFFIESLSVLNNMYSTCKLCGFNPDKTYIDNLLGELGIVQLSHKKPGQLSRGELQRFSIARALVNKPSVLLADEPTSSLDDDNCQKFIELMKQTVETYQLSLIVSTHDARIKSEFKHCIAL